MDSPNPVLCGFGFMVGSERWWLVLPPPLTKKATARYVVMLAATLSTVLIAGFFVRGIVGPLARLGEAVAATGGGRALGPGKAKKSGNWLSGTTPWLASWPKPTPNDAKCAV